MKIIEPESGAGCGLALWDLFLKPWVAMVCWGAFVHMGGFSLPTPGYWEFFVLALALGILTSSRISRWVLRDKP